MVTIYFYQNGDVRRLALKELHGALESHEGVVWIDMEDPNEAEEETLLVSMFCFHHLAVEDARRGADEEGHLPKVEDFGDYLFVIFNPVEGIIPSGDEDHAFRFEIKTSQLSAFLMQRVLVTHHYKPLRSISYATTSLSKNAQALGRGPDFMFHMIIDEIVDSYTPILDRLDEGIDSIEEDVFHEPTQTTMIRLLELKRNIMTIRRIAMYQREMLNRLSRGEFRLVTSDEIAYYRNVYDHLVRMTEVADTYRDLISSLLDAYLSVTSNKLNQVMKVLTIISTIFLPLSVITGFFGMNFHYLPLANWEHGILVTTGFMVLVAGGMLWVFKRNRWL
jgi:magnesium transporter